MVTTILVILRMTNMFFCVFDENVVLMHNSSTVVDVYTWCGMYWWVVMLGMGWGSFEKKNILKKKSWPGAGANFSAAYIIVVLPFTKGRTSPWIS